MKRTLAVCCLVGAACGAVAGGGGSALAWPGCPTPTSLSIQLPATGGKYTFNNQSPGEAAVSCCACADPVCNNPLVDWAAETVVGSQKIWNPDPPQNDNSVTLKYRGLPSNNTQFGNTWVRAMIAEYSLSDQNTLKLFFAEEATNHPGGGTPNWFYYWAQTGAGYGSLNYDANSGLGRIDYVGGAWKAFLGHEDNEGYTPPEGDNGGNALDGIDSFAWAARHEGRHVTTSTAWYPNGYDGSIDGDADWVPNAQEASLGGTQQNPINGGPFTPGVWDTDGDGQRDDEDYTCNTQSPWVEGSKNSEDWANPGHQY
jgi:hypothetical protein